MKIKLLLIYDGLPYSNRLKSRVVLTAKSLQLICIKHGKSLFSTIFFIQFIAKLKILCQKCFYCKPLIFQTTLIFTAFLFYTLLFCFPHNTESLVKCFINIFRLCLKMGIMGKCHIRPIRLAFNAKIFYASQWHLKNF